MCGILLWHRFCIVRFYKNVELMRFSKRNITSLVFFNVESLAVNLFKLRERERERLIKRRA